MENSLIVGVDVIEHRALVHTTHNTQCTMPENMYIPIECDEKRRGGEVWRRWIEIDDIASSKNKSCQTRKKKLTDIQSVLVNVGDDDNDDDTKWCDFCFSTKWKWNKQETK